jgi:glycosyltransferase involved in cell wall biosynthesis
MKRILQISSRLPYPLDDGGLIASWNLSRCLHHNGYLIDLICFVRDSAAVEASREPLSSVFESVTAVIKNVERQYPMTLLRSMLKRSSYFVEKFYEDELVGHLRDAYARRTYDVTLIDSAFMGVYAPRVREYAEAAGRIVLRGHNVEFELLDRLAKGEKRPWYKPLLQREARLFKGFELALVEEVDQVCMITARDATVLKQAGAAVDPMVLSPFIDMNRYNAGGEDLPEPGSLVCVGNMAWMPNRNGVLWFCEKVWPMVRAARPGAKFYIVGKNPPPEISRLDGDGVVVTGYVEDERPYIARAHLFIVPLLEGSGIRIKILTAMAMGRSVLSTTVGAEGIAWEGLMVCDDPGDWISEIVRHLDTPPTVNTDAVEHIRRHYDWRRELAL